jgi:hypothetical protein
MDGSSCVRALTAGPTYRPNLPARIERSRNSFQLALATEGKKLLGLSVIMLGLSVITFLVDTPISLMIWIHE